MRKARIGLAAVALLVPWAATAAAGTLQGKVVLVEKGGREAKDLDGAVVWVEGPKLQPKPAGATVRMKGKAFLPRVSVVTVGGSVAFPNEDSIFHNAFSVSGDNAFDLQLYKKPKSVSNTFKHPGVVRVYCNIHPQMSAYVLVLDTPLWASVAGDGSFRIDDVPAGRWVLKAWHERSGEASQEIRVSETGTASVSISLDASGFRRAPHKNKYGKDYKAGEKY